MNNNKTYEKLAVVMPVYNEEGAIAAVLDKWTNTLDALQLNYEIRAYNDGSKDGTLKVMREWTASHPAARVSVCDKANSGHGSTILQGYREAARDGFDWVFQIDSDDEMGPESFGELWSHREDKDFVVGYRDGRKQPLARKVISFISRLTVKLFYGAKTIWDVNTPYRLMRVSTFTDLYEKIPTDTFAPNVIISGLVARQGLRYFEMPVPQHDRQTGEVSIKKWKLLKAAVKSFRQTIWFGARHMSIRQACCLIGILSLTCFAMLSVIVGSKNGLNFVDFQYNPIKIMSMGENPYLYSLKNVRFENFQVDANQVPSCLLLLLPFTWLCREWANNLWMVCNLVWTAVFLLFVFKMWFSGDDIKSSRTFSFIVISLLLLAGTPWRVLIGNGQHLMFSLAFFMVSYYFRNQNKWMSGILLAISMFKYTTIFPLLMIFVFERNFRPLIVCFGLHLIATLGVACYLSESPVTLVIQSLQVGSALTGQGMADIASLLGCYGVVNTKIAANAGYIVLTLFLMLLTWKGKCDSLLKLSVFAIVSNMLFYHRVYDFVTLFIPMMYVVKNDSKLSWPIKIVFWGNVSWLFFLYI